MEDLYPSANVSLYIRLIGGISYATCASTSIVANIILAVVLLKDNAYFKEIPFYLIVWQMIYCDLVTQVLQLYIAVPITLTAKQIYGLTLLLYVPAFFDTIGHWGTLMFAFLTALNRLSVFMSPSVHRVFFTNPGIHFTILAMWSFVFGLVAAFNSIGCKKSFAHDGFYMYHDCKSNLSESAKAVLQVAYYLSTYLPAVMFFAYVVIILHIKYARKYRGGQTSSSVARPAVRTRTTNMMKEYRLLIQSVIICGFLELQSIAFTTFPYLPLHGDWVYYISFFQGHISTVNNTVSPIVYFLFNKDIQTRVLKLFAVKPSKTAPLTSANIFSTNVGGR